VRTPLCGTWHAASAELTVVLSPLTIIMARPQPEDAVSPSSSPMKRSPLTPIPVDGHRAIDDPKLVLSSSDPSVSRSHSDDELHQHPTIYQRRKSSVSGLWVQVFPSLRLLLILCFAGLSYGHRIIVADPTTGVHLPLATHQPSQHHLLRYIHISSPGAEPLCLLFIFTKPSRM
jgi:hypothetical protein